jgi:ABC-2 type transport system ATP-binding protein
MTSPIHTHALTRRYGRQMALDGLDLDVPEGSIFGLVGPNGAGKTTAIKILMKLVRPSSGEAEVLGCDIRKLGPAQFARIGYVSENQKLPDWMTVGYFMNYLRPFYPTWDDTLAVELIRQFELPRDRKLRHLSHGMRMKAAMAAALAYRPKLIVLDEPFTGLDPLVRDELIEGLLPRTENTTVFISSHDLAEIESFASHIGFLDRGRLQFSEEMSALAERFREVEVTMGGAPPSGPRRGSTHSNRPRFADLWRAGLRRSAPWRRYDGCSATPCRLRSTRCPCGRFS